MKALRLFAANLAVCALLGVVFVAGLEAWLRLTIPESSGDSIFQYTLQTKRYKLMRPYARIVAWGEELRTNALGFRGADIPSKAPGEFRIVVLGDSFTVSAGVAETHIYTSLLERRLRREFPQVRVVNLAVAGYNVVQYSLVLLEVGLDLQPDLVLVALFPENDFSQETYDANRRGAEGYVEPEAAWYEASYAWRAYLGRAVAVLSRFLPQADAAPAGPRYTQTDGWEVNTAALHAIADATRQRGIPFAVTMLPHTWHFDRQQPLFTRVMEHCRRYTLPCVSLLEPFMATGVRETSLQLNPLDSHPNPAYNALVADFLETPLIELLRVRTGRASPPGLSPVAAGRQLDRPSFVLP